MSSPVAIAAVVVAVSADAGKVGRELARLLEGEKIATAIAPNARTCTMSDDCLLELAGTGDFIIAVDAGEVQGVLAVQLVVLSRRDRLRIFEKTIVESSKSGASKLSSEAKAIASLLRERAPPVVVEEAVVEKTRIAETAPKLIPPIEEAAPPASKTPAIASAALGGVLATVAVVFWVNANHHERALRDGSPEIATREDLTSSVNAGKRSQTLAYVFGATSLASFAGAALLFAIDL